MTPKYDEMLQRVARWETANECDVEGRPLYPERILRLVRKLQDYETAAKRRAAEIRVSGLTVTEGNVSVTVRVNPDAQAHVIVTVDGREVFEPQWAGVDIWRDAARDGKDSREFRGFVYPLIWRAVQAALERQ